MAFVYLLSCVIVDAAALHYSAQGVIMGSMIFTAPGGIGVAFNFNLTYLPEVLSFNHGGNQLTALRIETQEDGVLHDWNAAALNAMNGYQRLGAMTANDINLLIADGELRPKNVTISGITSAVGAINFYAESDNKGTVPFSSVNAAILALNPTLFKKFTALFIPTMATLTDYAEILYVDGHNQRWEMEDIRRYSSRFQQVEGIVINNIDGLIKEVKVTCAAQTPAYLLKVNIPEV